MDTTHATYTISKKYLIKVLKSEPLLPGDWISTNAKKGETCAVCAVGSIVRTLLNHSRSEEQMRRACFHVTNNAFGATGFREMMFKTKNTSRTFKHFVNEYGPMAALSSYFEHLGEKTRITQEFSDLEDRRDEIVGTQFDREVNKLLKKSKQELVPKIIEMVELHFPDTIHLDLGGY
jgi:hypothetical protein